MKQVIILGAAGRDFHNFNTFFRDKEEYRVVAFTATQIPRIENRIYPPSLAGSLYPNGIPIRSEGELPQLIEEERVDEVIFAYSDVSYEYLMHRAALVNSCGADFRLLGPAETTIKAQVPVVTVCAVRTGCGKSQTTRRISDILLAKGRKIVVIRHPMPYGDLESQRVQRFATQPDLDTNRCTIEEREEFEPHLRKGIVVYAGVDYQAITEQAEKEAEILLWDGGNNDTPFLQSDLHVVVADPLRGGHEFTYYPGETNLRLADVIVINKEDTADWDQIQRVRQNARLLNPEATLIDAASPIFATEPEAITGRRIIAIEDGPTITHGEMEFGAGYLAAQKYGAKEIIDPRPFAVNSIASTYEKFPQIGPVLPAMGYGNEQIRDLETTVNRSDADFIVVATPIDLSRLIQSEKPMVRVTYELIEIGRPTLEDVLTGF